MGSVASCVEVPAGSCGKWEAGAATTLRALVQPGAVVGTGGVGAIDAPTVSVGAALSTASVEEFGAVATELSEELIGSAEVVNGSTADPGTPRDALAELAVDAHPEAATAISAVAASTRYIYIPPEEVATQTTSARTC
jgi:hypothetical protein